MRRAFLVLCAFVACAACSSKKAALAELTKADGPVDRQAGGQEIWEGAPIGTKYYLGDAARTGDGGAELVLAGAARIAMQPHTVLRFGGTADQSKIEVEVGAVTLSGAGTYGLAVGQVELGKDGAIRIAAAAVGGNTVQLVVGQAQLVDTGGQTQQLQIGQVVGLALGKISVEKVVDAGVPDAARPPADAGATDAGTAAASEAQIEVTGKGAQILPPGEKKWTKLAAGAGTLAPGTELRLDARTTAKLVATGTTLELAGGSHAKVGDDLVFGLELGTGTASVPAGGSGKVGVPGGQVELVATADSPAQARIDVNARGEAKVAALRGGAKLTGGGGGATLELARGENATLLRAGSISPGDTVIPKYFDFQVRIGDVPAFTIHDPAGATAVRFDFNGKCRAGGVVELDHDARFRTPRISAGKDAANLLVRAGGWAYRLRCSTGADEGPAVASGRIVVRHDSGTRPLPKDPPRFPIDADGRNYRVDYQSLIPNIRVHAPGAAGAATLHLASGGSEQTFESADGSFDVPGKALQEGEYTYWVERGGVKSKVSTLRIGFDQTAAQVYIESPANGAAWGPEILVRGATLPGWTAKVDDIEVPVDKATRRFSAKIAPPAEGKALAIRLSHPLRGVHYYLRRGAP